MSQPEPWLRGEHAGLHPAAAHLLYTFEQTREELARYCSHLSTAELSLPPRSAIAAVGFHLRHIAGSVDRLTTYLIGEQLSESQLEALRNEHQPASSFDSLMELIESQFRRTEAVVKGISPATYEERRAVGRQQLPTTVGGLIVHISEHTQRHLGQAILTAKLVG